MSEVRGHSRGIGAVNIQVAENLEELKSPIDLMDPAMDQVELFVLDCQTQNDVEVSLADCRSYFIRTSTSKDSSIIHMNDENPSTNWQLPKIVPSEVYNLKWWRYHSATQIKVMSIDVSFSDSNDPTHINLLDQTQIDWALKEGYSYAHLGAIKLGLDPLVRPFLPVSSLCVAVDTHHVNFADAIIGGFSTPLHNGPAHGTIFPKFSVSLKDPHIYDLLKAYIQPWGFRMLPGSKIIQLKDAFCVRFGNDTLPPLHSKVHQSSCLLSVVESGSSTNTTPILFD